MTIPLVLHTLWCLAVFLTCTLVIPTFMTAPHPNLLDRASRGVLRAGCFWVVSACLLGVMRCYNIATLISLGLCLFVIHKTAADGKSIRATLLVLLQQVATKARQIRDAFCRPPRESLARYLLHSSWLMRRMRAVGQLPVMTLVFIALVIGVSALSFGAHLIHLTNTRLLHSDEYVCLIRARQLLLNTRVLSRPLLVPALASATSLISTAHPINVIRTLALLMPLLATLALGRVVFLLSGSLLAASAAMYCQNVEKLSVFVWHWLDRLVKIPGQATEYPGHSLEHETALLFLLLWITVLLRVKTIDRRELLTCSLACVIILEASSPMLLLSMPMVGLMCVVTRPRIAFFVGSVVFLAIVAISLFQGLEVSAFAAELLPYVLGLLAGLGMSTLERRLVSYAGLLARPIIALAGLGVAFFWLPILPERARPLEYDSVALATNSITQQFGRQRWSIAAPVDQFAEVYALGDFQDLATLVGSTPEGDLAKSLESNDALDNLFIFVEKAPLSPFDKEPDIVPFSVLTDATYRNYRSPAGRASLEALAMQLCERYKATHATMSIFFEDEYVRVYRLTRSHAASLAPSHTQ